MAVFKSHFSSLCWKGISAFAVFFSFMVLFHTNVNADVNVLCIQGLQSNLSENVPSVLMPKVYSAFSNAKYTESSNVSYYTVTSDTSRETFISQLNNAFSSASSKDLNIIYYFGEGVIASQEGDGTIQMIAAIFWQYWYRSSIKNGIMLGTDYMSYYDLGEQLMVYNGKFVLILDCCGSGGFNKYAYRRTANNSDEDNKKLNKITCITASRDDRASHGKFTKDFLTCIGYDKYKSMKADKDKNGFVSAKELYKALCGNSICFKGNNNPNLLSFAYTEITTKTEGKTYTINDSLTMKASVKRNGGRKLKVKWKTNNDVASINSKGKVTFKKSGTVKITSYLTDPNGKMVLGSESSREIKVVVPTVQLDKSEVTLYKGQTLTLHATMTGTTKKPSWSSSNKRVVTVNSKGEIKAKKTGKATIKVSVNGVSASCKVSVTKMITKEQAETAVRNYVKKKQTSNYYYFYNGKDGDYYTFWVTYRGVYMKEKYYVHALTGKTYTCGPYCGVNEWKKTDKKHYRFDANKYLK